MVTSNQGGLSVPQGQIGLQVVQLEQAMTQIPQRIREFLAQAGKAIDPAGRFVDSASGTTVVVQQAPTATALGSSQAAFVAAKQAGMTGKSSDGPLINIEKVEVVSPSPEKVPGELFDKVGTEAWRLGWN
jgi:hypothetical protein